MLIARAAYFALCTECGCHAYISCPDGTKSEDFATQAAGLEALTALVIAGKVAEDEVPELRRQIEESSLERRNDELDALLATLTDLKKDFDGFHRRLRRDREMKKRHSPADKRTLH